MFLTTGRRARFPRPLHAPHAPSSVVRLHPLALATLIATATLAPQFATAQTVAAHAPQQAVRRFDIPAGPLEGVLNRLGRETGVLIGFGSVVTEGLRSKGVNGSLTVQDALSQALAGTGLGAVRSAGGGYALSALPASGARPVEVGGAARMLAEVRVEARRAADGTTEGTGSYTSRVTSIASKTDQSFREIPQSVSVMTREQLDDRQISDIRDALAATPGITTTKLNFDSSYYYARGFQIDSMQIDGGAPLNIASYTYSTNQDLAFYDRVEVMRGASGLLGGVGDPGGIINLVRKKPLATPQFVVEQSVGRWNSYRTMVDATGPLAADGRVRGRAVLSYEDRDFHVDITHNRSPKIYGVIEADLTPDTLLTFGGSYGKVKSTGQGGGDVPRYSDGSDIGLPRRTSLTQDWAVGERKNTELFAALEHRFANRWKLRLNLTHTKSDYEGGTAFGYGALDRATGTGVAWYGGGRYDYANTQDVADLSLSGTFQLAGRTHEFLVGADRQRIKSFWNVGYSPDANGSVPLDVFNPGAWQPSEAGPDSRRYNPWGQEQYGGYGVLRLHPTERLHLIAGARVARYSFDQVYESLDAGGWGLSSGSRFDEPAKTTPYGGVIYDLNSQWSAYASYSAILKPQALSKSGPPPGNSLGPVEGKSYEAGLKGELANGKLNATLSVFNVERTGTAVLDTRYPDSREEWSGNCCYLPQGKVTSRGFDVEIGGEIARGWQVAAGYTFANTKDKSTDTAYSSITPKHMLKLSTTYTLPGELSRWKIGGSAHIQSSHYVKDTLYDADYNALGTYDFTQGGYAVLNAMVQYRIDPRWTLSLNVNTLSDKVYYQTVGYASGSNFYGTSREWLLTLRGTF